MSDFVIEASELRKSYGRSTALNGLNLQVSAGSVYGFPGRNGAGKTTTIKLLMGLLNKDSGAARVFGISCAFEGIQRMLKEEVDYTREADNLRHARALFQSEDGIVVPRLYEEYSTKRVLTTEYLPGLHLNDFPATNPSQEARNSFGTKMYTVWYRMYYGNINYADPHSGNYLFMGDGRLGLLDFGCVQNYNAEERELMNLTDKLVDSWDPFPEFLRRCANATENDLANPEYVALMKELCSWMFEAIAESSFDFGDETHLKARIDCFSRLIGKRYTQAHPMYICLFRSVFGLKALL